jgi:uncharacterized membrane protein YGL010W
MNTLEQNLTQYAAYHRDRRNIATHFAGIPMIMFALVLALGAAAITVAGVSITGAAIACVALAIYYLRQDLRYGIAMALFLFALCAAASETVPHLSAAGVAGWATALFAIGWALQFLGHRFEGMKPAFYDDARQLFVGPLFMCAEASFMLGLREPLRRYIEDRVGPTVARRERPGVAMRP